MKTLYLECAMGAAGDMLMAALYDLMDEEQRTSFINQMNNLGLDGVEVLATRAESHGISGSHMHVVVGGVEEGELLANGNDTQHGHEHSAATPMRRATPATMNMPKHTDIKSINIISIIITTTPHPRQ